MIEEVLEEQQATNSDTQAIVKKNRKRLFTAV